MKSNKPPGLYGLPVEFYQCFFGSAIFIFKEIFQSDEMIHFIFNKMVKIYIKNHRPISLTNTNKIIALIFARRFQKVIDEYKSKEQTAYIKERCIGTNERLILNIFEYYEK